MDVFFMAGCCCVDVQGRFRHDAVPQKAVSPIDYYLKSPNCAQLLFCDFLLTFCDTMARRMKTSPFIGVRVALQS
jgi:hypothetical protein